MPRPDQAPFLAAVTDAVTMYTQEGSGIISQFTALQVKSYVLTGTNSYTGLSAVSYASGTGIVTIDDGVNTAWTFTIPVVANTNQVLTVDNVTGLWALDGSGGSGSLNAAFTYTSATNVLTAFGNTFSLNNTDNQVLSLNANGTDLELTSDDGIDTVSLSPFVSNVHTLISEAARDLLTGVSTGTVATISNADAKGNPGISWYDGAAWTTSLILQDKAVVSQVLNHSAALLLTLPQSGDIAISSDYDGLGNPGLSLYDGTTWQGPYGFLSASSISSAINVGAGVGVFYQTLTNVAQFKSFTSSDGSISITDNTTEIDLKVVVDFGRFRGTHDASGGIVPTTTSGGVHDGDSIEGGDYWLVTTGGTIVGIGGEDVLTASDVILANIDNASINSQFSGLEQSSVELAVISSTSLSLLGISVATVGSNYEVGLDINNLTQTVTYNGEVDKIPLYSAASLTNKYISITDLQGYNTVSISADTTMSSSDYNKIYWIDASASDITLSLPTAIGFSGKWIMAKVINISGVFKASLVPTGVEEIDLRSSKEMNVLNEATKLISDGSGWKLFPLS